MRFTLRNEGGEMDTAGLFGWYELEGASGVVEIEEEKMSFHLESFFDETHKSI